MEIKIIETKTVETSLIELLENKKRTAKNNIEVSKAISDRFPGFLIYECQGYIEALDEVINILKENEIFIE